MRIGDLDLRLLRESPVGITRFELLVILDRLLVLAIVQARLGFGIELRGGPAFGLVIIVLHPRARGERPADKDREDYR